MTPISTLLWCLLAVIGLACLPWAIMRIRAWWRDFITFLDDEEWLP